jgi:hypothetical protein
MRHNKEAIQRTDTTSQRLRPSRIKIAGTCPLREEIEGERFI